MYETWNWFGGRLQTRVEKKTRLFLSYTHTHTMIKQLPMAIILVEYGTCYKFQCWQGVESKSLTLNKQTVFFLGELAMRPKHVFFFLFLAHHKHFCQRSCIVNLFLCVLVCACLCNNFHCLQCYRSQSW